MSRLLITGGTGYIGSHSAVALSKTGHQVVLYDNLSNSNRTILQSLGLIVGHHMSFVEGDVRDTKLLISTLTSHNIDAVIHFAGLKAVGESVEKPVDYYANNVQGAISLLQAMQFAQVKTLVFSSSATVYGEPRYLPLNESHSTIATNPYGRSKLHVEEMLADIAASDADWRIACLRYFNPVGAHESGLIGENPSGIPNNLMPYLAQVATGQIPELSVFGDDYPTTDGTGVRDFIHVMDLAEGHILALTYLSRNTGWHAVNLGTGKGYSVLDMIQAFEKASGRQVPYKIAPRRAGDVAICYSDPKKASELLKWRAARTLDDMCASTWRFHQFRRLSVES
ncbi:UDP-glucose 4-epimerase GalE [Polynucleobacter sp. MWH-Braz-FAM2G]|uniref:UDP-glucose 4-epimerase GalE n=1 Tax=Polynucleobacter sp. MWH-Braz-FAM2G TaxID=1855883 RepID=UPI00203BA5C8|nr:UDP-glucose 4-epimerase GalE [Polynucleobacter sp. MWH-Braz-FAM2G]